ncbi:unnamed protein product, partial [Urochloa humidicola]
EAARGGGRSSAQSCWGSCAWRRRRELHTAVEDAGSSPGGGWQPGYCNTIAGNLFDQMPEKVYIWACSLATWDGIVVRLPRV